MKHKNLFLIIIDILPKEDIHAKIVLAIEERILNR